jgi:hypothetical protein
LDRICSSFVAGADEYVDNLNPNEVASLQKLQQMIRTGAVKVFGGPLPDPLSYVDLPVPGSQSDNLAQAKAAWLLDPYWLLERLFEHKEQLPEGPYEEVVIQEQELPQLRAKLPKDDMTAERFLMAFEGYLKA